MMLLLLEVSRYFVLVRHVSASVCDGAIVPLSRSFVGLQLGERMEAEKDWRADFDACHCIASYYLLLVRARFKLLQRFNLLKRWNTQWKKKKRKKQRTILCEKVYVKLILYF